MRLFVLAFLAGIYILQTFSLLPSLFFIAIIIFLTCVVYFTLKKKIYLCLFFGVSFGFIWAFWVAHIVISNRISDDLEGKTIAIIGSIASIPSSSLRTSSFFFSLKELNHQPRKGLLHLSWRDAPALLQVGDKWELMVRLKKPYGTLNPGGFDYEAWALQFGLSGNGYVINKLKNTCLGHSHAVFDIDRARQFLIEKITNNMKPSPTSPWIVALVTGERNNIDQEQWTVLRNTGTNHLMAIAGLHIGILAMLAHAFVGWAWKRIPFLTLRIPAIQAASIAALFVALIYSAMSGFSLPTERASLMLTLFIMTVLMRRHVGAWQIWSSGLFLVLIVNPLSVLTESFWLSFGSVALIIYGMSGRLNANGLWWKWGRIQWVISLGLLPFSIALFQQFSLISFIANAFAIPFVGFLVVPLTLLGSLVIVVSSKTGSMILNAADGVLGLVWKVLTWLSHLPHTVWYQQIPSAWIFITAIVGVIFLLFPVGLPGRYLGLIWLLPLGLYVPNNPQGGEVWLSLLDVGQGLSAVVQTEKHVLVFDAGAHLSDNFDMGNSTVNPFLHTLHTKKIDMLVISHGDNDHIGGANAILKEFPVASIKTSVPEKFVSHADLCLQGMAWEWDGVNFSFLYPSNDNLHLNNNSSCVLLISNGNHTILLTGDIEKLAEEELVKNQKSYLPADVLVAPHHGSKTSAVNSFIAAVHPRDVLFPVGYRNKYHFPHDTVIKKYSDLHSVAYDTVHSGAIQYKIYANGDLMTPLLYRQVHKHYWNN